VIPSLWGKQIKHIECALAVNIKTLKWKTVISL
jgi:hypothetical protein